MRAVALDELHRLVAIGRLGDDGDTGISGKDRADTRADHGLVVGDQNPDHRTAFPV